MRAGQSEFSGWLSLPTSPCRARELPGSSTKRAWSQARRADDPEPVEACKAPGPGSSHPEAGDRGGPCSNGYPGCGRLDACADHW